MPIDFEKGNYGDSARNEPENTLKVKNFNHVFDGAGENVQYHSDSDSLGSRKSRTRYINPAIYIESVEASQSVTSLQTDSSSSRIDDITPHPHSNYCSNSTPILSGRGSSVGSVKRKSCRLVGADTVCQGHLNDETPRNINLTYREDGPDTFRLSVASLSTTTSTKEEQQRNERKKQEAFQQWLARKEQEVSLDRAQNVDLLTTLSSIYFLTICKCS